MDIPGHVFSTSWGGGLTRRLGRHANEISTPRARSLHTRAHPRHVHAVRCGLTTNFNAHSMSHSLVPRGNVAAPVFTLQLQRAINTSLLCIFVLQIACLGLCTSMLYAYCAAHCYSAKLINSSSGPVLHISTSGQESDHTSCTECVCTVMATIINYNNIKMCCCCSGQIVYTTDVICFQFCVHTAHSANTFPPCC